jgi:thymidylate synthase (FAD)
MNDLEMRDHSTVEVIQQVGDDDMIAMAARVSSGKDRTVPPQGNGGLINTLMKNAHGSPFEHGSITFRIETPIFGWSYNETSGRYRQLDPIFHVPARDRPLAQKGTSMHPELVPGDRDQYEGMDNRLRHAYDVAWANYEGMLGQGIAKEVARMCLPVGIYTSMYATANPRSMMNFLNLRLAENAQYEIRMVAQHIEEFFTFYWPMTHAAWVANGRPPV